MKIFNLVWHSIHKGEQLITTIPFLSLEEASNALGCNMSNVLRNVYDADSSIKYTIEEHNNSVLIQSSEHYDNLFIDEADLPKVKDCIFHELVPNTH